MNSKNLKSEFCNDLIIIERSGKRVRMERGTNRRETGAEYERLAGDYLKEKGYRILSYNFRCRFGEIDIIARDGAYLVFVEVKYRKSAGAGSPAEAVDKRKQHVISRVASYYRMIHGMGEEAPCRFDVVAVLGDRVTLYQNAFEYRE